VLTHEVALPTAEVETYAKASLGFFSSDEEVMLQLVQFREAH